jgi:dihydrofolate synthase/folylpolyglutamate synthase
VTQFEALTAAAYSELARAGVEVAVIEAGLGGRYDATNVIPSKVQVLTSVGLEHTRWLGPTIADIAREKLDVVQPGATLVLGPGCIPTPAVARASRASAARRSSRGHRPGCPGGRAGAFQRRNFALARAAAEAYLGELDPSAVAAAAAEVRVPGRLQQIAIEPLTLLDGAHNPDGMRRWPSRCPSSSAATIAALVAVVSILDDKDAAGMLAACCRRATRSCSPSSQNPRALPPPTLQSLPASSVDRRRRSCPTRAPRSSARASSPGPQRRRDRTGSIYLVADLLATRAREHASARLDAS